ncbi:MAG: cation transporter, partial [candidate division NC10 bacterium]
LGNEAVALFRIRVGRDIGSVALVADGYHARVDGLTSLAVLGGVVGAWLGYPLADPVFGLLITIVILHLVWQSAGAVFARMLDGVDRCWMRSSTPHATCRACMVWPRSALAGSAIASLWN